MNRFLPGKRLELQESGERLWFLPAECEVIESMLGLRGRTVRARLSTPIPLRNSEIAEVILVVEDDMVCEVYMGLSDSMTLDPILQLGKAKVA